MKQASLCCLLFATLLALGQEKSEITVKSGTTTSTGVVIVTAEGGKKTIELLCNEGAHSCTIPQAGMYSMVRLPKNRGLYDCANVELYQGSSSGEGERKIGEYCLTQ